MNIKSTITGIFGRITRFFHKKEVEKVEIPVNEPSLEEKVRKEVKRKEKYRSYSFKELIRYFSKDVFRGDGKCVVCGTNLSLNNSKQIKLYCSKPCRHARHNKKHLQEA